MSEKRFSFNVNKNQFAYDNKYYAFCNVIDANKIVNKLNALLIEKRMLELEIEKLEVIIKTGNCSLLQKENKQLKKEKKAIQQENLSIIDFMNANFDEHMTQEKLNRRIIELTNENKELKKDLEYWKSNCLSYKNQNSILWNEISILQKQGAETSASFEEYVDSISTEHTRYWKRKLNKAKKDGVIE